MPPFCFHPVRRSEKLEFLFVERSWDCMQLWKRGYRHTKTRAGARTGPHPDKRKWRRPPLAATPKNPCSETSITTRARQAGHPRAGTAPRGQDADCHRDYPVHASFPPAIEKFWIGEASIYRVVSGLRKGLKTSRQALALLKRGLGRDHPQRRLVTAGSGPSPPLPLQHRDV